MELLWTVLALGLLGGLINAVLFLGRFQRARPDESPNLRHDLAAAFLMGAILYGVILGLIYFSIRDSDAPFWPAFYIFGIALLGYGTFEWARSLDSLDNMPALRAVSAFATAWLGFLVAGFFLFKWYVPLLGLLVAPLLGRPLSEILANKSHWMSSRPVKTLLGLAACIVAVGGLSFAK